MPKKLQFKRFPHSTVNNTTGADGELIVDTTTKTLTVHDGVTAGGSRLATELYVSQHSTYSNTNVAGFLPGYGGPISATMLSNTRSITCNTDYVNVGSIVGFQLQYDPSGEYNLYDIKEGSWIYFDGSGYTWQSNTTGTSYVVYFDNVGNISADGNITAKVNVAANNVVTNTVIFSTNSSITNENGLMHLNVSDGFNQMSWSLRPDGQLMLPTSTQGGIAGGWVTSTSDICFNAAGNLWKFGADGTMSSPYSVQVTTTGFKYPDGTTQNTAYQLVSIPTTSKGQSGDKINMMAANNTYLYYCTANYTDGLTDIWKRIQWSNNTW